jgi:hypothetical protein
MGAGLVQVEVILKTLSNSDASICKNDTLQIKMKFYHTLCQVAGLGQVEVVFKKISNPDSKLTDGSTCKQYSCSIKMKVTFKEPERNESVKQF